MKSGVCKQELFAGSQRRLMNQHRVGVFSHYKLRDIIKGKSEHLSTDGSVCREDDVLAN